MNTQRLCPGCQKPLAPDAPMGLCPECLIQAGFATGAETATKAGTTSAFIPPTLVEMAGFFPQLEILEFIGKGGMGAVYKARQKQLDRIVALKILPPGVGLEAGFAERFAREARALARLNHPGIVTLFEFGEASGLYFFLMEFVDGVNLRQLLASRQISSREALSIVPQICDALQFAHDQGIVHRDIKPENILLDRRGRVKLADFGLAKLMGAGNETSAGTGSMGSSPSLTEVGKVMGTPNYMAPEQVDHPDEVDNRADIYALGVVFYQMLTGQLPGKPIEPPSHKVHIDVRLDEVVMRALEKKPALRYQQASEFKTKVENLAGNPPVAGFAAASAGSAPPPPMGPASPLRPGTINGLAPGAGSVTAPAIGLLVAGLWKAFHALIVLILFSRGSWLNSLVPIEDLVPGLNVGTLVLSSTVLFTLIPGILILFGAVQMLKLRSYAWAMGAAILAIVACSVLGFIAGIWAVVVLSRPAVREAFNPSLPRQQPSPGSGPRGGGWLVAVVVFLILMLLLAGMAGIFLGLPQLNHKIYADASPGGKLYRDINLSLPISADGSFSLENENGQITIIGGEGDGIIVKGVKHGGTQEALDAVKADVVAETNRIVIRTRYPARGFPWNWTWFKHNDVKVDYTVQVPSYTRLANIDSVNGQIHISGVSGDITASTVNGQAEVADAAGNLKMNTVNGQIQVEFDRLGEHQEVSFDSVNGSIRVLLPASAEATVSASTMNGEMTSEFSNLTIAKQFPLGSSLKGSLGAGGAQVHATAVNGAIHFARATELSAEAASIMAGQPPVVVETQPPAGAEAVEPGDAEIRVRFSKPMADGTWSWGTAWPGSTPEIISGPHLEPDGRTCVIKVKLEPGKKYGYWLNAENFQSFQDRTGHAAVPYLLMFQTKSN